MEVTGGDARLFLVELGEVIPVACTACVGVSFKLHAGIFPFRRPQGKQTGNKSEAFAFCFRWFSIERMKCFPISGWFATGLLLCTLAVFAAAWPALNNPRLEADDYRYLHHIQQGQAGTMGAIEAMTVENRWDHLWFMQEEGVIRFFRPTYGCQHRLVASILFMFAQTF